MHIAVIELFCNKPESNEKLEVDHIDGNKLNNKIDNLRWVTHLENCNNEVSKAKISAILKGKLKGKPKSEAHRAKISAALKKYWKKRKQQKPGSLF